MLQIVSVLNGLNVDASWHSFLSKKEVKDELIRIDELLKREASVTPTRNRLLRFLEVDLRQSKIVILGQDPYPQPGVATGRAFEVGTLQSWDQTFRNTSLKNIVRALYAAEKDQFFTFNEIKKILTNKVGFYLLSPNQLFQYWEKQGILLLNTSFSCRVGEPGSHASVWELFSKLLLLYIHQTKPELTWLLWGNHAKKAVSHLDLNNFMVSTHPMICHQRPDDFLYGNINHFKATQHLVDWTGKEML